MTQQTGKQYPSKQTLLNLILAVLGLSLIAIGYTLFSSKWQGAGFVGGFLFMTGIQMFCWVIGIRMEILGNVTDDTPRISINSETGQGTSAIPQH